jgi:hypothetical protein
MEALFIFPNFFLFKTWKNTILTHTKVFQETKQPLNLPDFGGKNYWQIFLYQVPAGN